MKPGRVKSFIENWEKGFRDLGKTEEKNYKQKKGGDRNIRFKKKSYW